MRFTVLQSETSGWPGLVLPYAPPSVAELVVAAMDSTVLPRGLPQVWFKSLALLLDNRSPLN